MMINTVQTITILSNNYNKESKEESVVHLLLYHFSSTYLINLKTSKGSLLLFE